MARLQYNSKSLILQGSGLSPVESSPMNYVVVDRAFQVDVTLKLLGQSEAGLLLFYNHKAFVGIGFKGKVIKSFQYAEEHPWTQLAVVSNELRLKPINDNQVITYQYSIDQGHTWQRHPTRMEVSGLNHNVFGGFLSLKTGIYCVGTGKVQLAGFRYRAIT